MGVNLITYRAAIGLFNILKIKLFGLQSHNELYKLLTLVLNLGLCILFVFAVISLILAGDIELNPGPKLSSLMIGHINARSLAVEEKFDEISSFILDTKFDVFAVTETWLDSKTLDNSLDITGYCSILRKDRLNMRGGGVALYASQQLAVKRHHDLECDNVEMLWAEIKLQNLNLLYVVFAIDPLTKLLMDLRTS